MIVHSTSSGGPLVRESTVRLFPNSCLRVNFSGMFAERLPTPIADRPGKIEAARGGTFFLDESRRIFPQACRRNFFRVLESGQIRAPWFQPDKNGRCSYNRRNATRSLKKKFRTADSREDLYYRLNVIPLYIPPLRRRTGGYSRSSPNISSSEINQRDQ
jgi:Nif-specific regulatory protein